MPCTRCADPARCDRFGVCQLFGFASYPRRTTPPAPDLTDAQLDAIIKRGSQTMASMDSRRALCRDAIEEDRKVRTAGEAAGAKRLPMAPTNHMMNAAVNAWHSWKSRDSGGNVQLLGRLMWEHMADAAPEAGVGEVPRG